MQKNEKITIKRFRKLRSILNEPKFLNGKVKKLHFRFYQSQLF